MSHQKEAIVISWTRAASQTARGKVVGVEEDGTDVEEGAPGELVENGLTKINILPLAKQVVRLYIYMNNLLCVCVCVYLLSMHIYTLIPHTIHLVDYTCCTLLYITILIIAHYVFKH